MQSYLFQINSIITNLPSGYNRDFQLTKQPLIDGFELVKDCVSIMSLVMANLKMDQDKCESACTEDIYEGEQAYDRVKQGTAFRDAYKHIAIKQK